MEGLAQRIPVDSRSKPFSFFVGTLPDRKGTSKQFAPFCGEDQDAAAAVRGVGVNPYQSAALERLQGRSQGGSIHREQGSDRPHGRRLRAIERHEQRKLPVGQLEGSKAFVETPCQSARCPLHMKTKTAVFDHESCFEGQRACA